jgi:hypothetical protein
MTTNRGEIHEEEGGSMRFQRSRACSLRVIFESAKSLSRGEEERKRQTRGEDG